MPGRLDVGPLGASAVADTFTSFPSPLVALVNGVIESRYRFPVLADLLDRRGVSAKLRGGPVHKAPLVQFGRTRHRFVAGNPTDQDLDRARVELATSTMPLWRSPN